MKTIDWTKDELVAYILLFAANADFKESAEERELIISKVDRQTFREIHEEFEADNDYQGLKKIMISPGYQFAVQLKCHGPMKTADDSCQQT